MKNYAYRAIAILAALGGFGLYVLYDLNIPETEVDTVVDRSGSTKEIRKREIASVSVQLENAPPRHTYVRLYRMGHSTQEVYSGSLDHAPLESIISTLTATTGSSDPRKGTNFALMAEALARSRSKASASKRRITILTDGGDDYAKDPALAERYRKAVDRICADPGLESVTFRGVKPEFRDPIRLAWGSIGSKLHILTSDQVDED